MQPEHSKMAMGILEAISKWHAGEVTVGTLAARLEIEPVVLIAALDANGICDHIGQLKNPELSHITVMTLAFIMLTSHKQVLKVLTNKLAVAEREIQELKSGISS